MVYIDDPYRKHAARSKRLRGTKFFLHRDLMVLSLAVPGCIIGYLMFRRLQKNPEAARRVEEHRYLPDIPILSRATDHTMTVLPRSAELVRVQDETHKQKTSRYYAGRPKRLFTFTLEDVELPILGPDGRFHIPVDNVQRICERNKHYLLTPKEPLPPSQLPKPDWMTEQHISFSPNFPSSPPAAPVMPVFCDDDDDVEVLIVRRTQSGNLSSNNASFQPGKSQGKRIIDVDTETTAESGAANKAKRPRSKVKLIARQTQLMVISAADVVSSTAPVSLQNRIKLQCVTGNDTLEDSASSVSISKMCRARRTAKNRKVSIAAAQQAEAAAKLHTKRVNCLLFTTSPEAVRQVAAGRLTAFLTADYQDSESSERRDGRSGKSFRRKSHVVRLAPSCVKFAPDASYQVTLFRRTISLWASAAQAAGTPAVLDEFLSFISDNDGFVPAFRSLTQIPGRDRTVLYCDTQSPTPAAPNDLPSQITIVFTSDADGVEAQPESSLMLREIEAETAFCDVVSEDVAAFQGLKNVLKVDSLTNTLLNENFVANEYPHISTSQKMLQILDDNESSLLNNSQTDILVDAES